MRAREGKWLPQGHTALGAGVQSSAGVCSLSNPSLIMQFSVRALLTLNGAVHQDPDCCDSRHMVGPAC